MESDGGKHAKQSGVRHRRYSIRYPFAADAEILELQSGSCVSGVTQSFRRFVTSPKLFVSDAATHCRRVSPSSVLLDRLLRPNEVPILLLNMLVVMPTVILASLR